LRFHLSFIVPPSVAKGSFLKMLMNNKFPPDFADALQAAGLADFFSGCTTAHQSEYLKWLREAKRPETRHKRITKAVEMLSTKWAEERKRARP